MTDVGAVYVEERRLRGFATPSVDGWFERTLETIPSAQLAVCRHGEPVVSLAGGPPGIGRPSLYLLYSSTKLYAAMVMWLLADRGWFSWDDPVAEHWPAFAANGKGAVTIRHVITHRAGLTPEPPATSWTWWGDRHTVGRMMERLQLAWEPGTAGGYHNRTWGFVLDQLVWRLTGHGIDTVLRTELAEPVGAGDLHLGLSEDLFRTRFVPTRYLGASPRAAGIPAGRDEFRVPIGGQPMFNAWELVRLPLAWGTATATAEAAARLAGFLAGRGRLSSVRIFTEDTFAEATTPQNPPGEVDRTLGRPVRWGLGVQVGMFDDIPALHGAVGHAGGRTVQVWAHPASGLSVAVVLGGVRVDDPEGPLGSDRWRREVAAAVAADLLGG